MLLTELNLVELTGRMLEENAGAMLLSRNLQEINRTKYADFKYHFIIEFIE